MTRRLIGFALVAAFAAPVAVQAQFSESYTFLKAVRDADGEKVTSILNKPGSGSVIINTRDGSTGEVAVHIVTKRRDTAWLAFLLAKGADPNIRDSAGNTALMLATALSFQEGMSLLIDRNANIELANSSGETPLIRAVQNRDLTSVRALLAAGANPNKADTASGLTARQHAERDPRAGTILAAINDAKPKAKAKVGPN